MGRMLFEITPVPAVMRHPRGSIPGLATCRVDLIDPADNAFGADSPNSVRSLRKRAIAADGSLRSKPPEQLMATAAEAVVPQDVLASLPDAALVAFRWGFTPGAGARPDKESS
jgi:hypothetical protein